MGDSFRSAGGDVLYDSPRLQALGDIGMYARVYVSRATAGDTGLHLAITLGSLSAAKVK